MPYQKPLKGDLYFLTLTIVDWVDVFTRDIYFKCIADNLQYCQKHKGLEIFAYVIMTNHLHLVARSQKQDLFELLRDFKSYTSKLIYRLIVENHSESRKNWIEYFLRQNGMENHRNKWHQFWQNGNCPKIMLFDRFIEQKVNYIHQNPVRAGFVAFPEDWKYSSASPNSPIQVSELWTNSGKRLT